MEQQHTQKRAILYRMVMPEHTCPWGLKARHLLRSRGYEVEDHWLTTKPENEVYVQKRELKCACVGGSSKVPLGFVSLSENLAMVGMALWMLIF